ncbi:hypothetical protein BU16DRAFT_532512 [Lophium mytilinum]|uniref:Uncharacterized protein n=1 Tax=Lophium mytilinum TaxID=390894 RepID=A0A6A6RBC9_9PEZI|nr:hypothetical protein BU16DRAFT_532512 [Lophium mytilinum]
MASSPSQIPAASARAAAPIAGTSAAASAPEPGRRIYNTPAHLINTAAFLPPAAHQNVRTIWVRNWDQMLFRHDVRAAFYKATLLFPDLTHIYFIALTPPLAQFAQEAPPVATRTADWHVDYFRARNMVALECLRDDLLDVDAASGDEPVEKYRFAGNWLPWEMERPFEDWHTVAGPEEWVDLRAVVLRRSRDLELGFLLYMRRAQGASEEIGELKRVWREEWEAMGRNVLGGE